MPIDWSIIVGDINTGSLEIMTLMHLMDKDFDVFCFNPINGYMPQFLKLEILTVWPDVKWFFPKLKNGHILTVPLQDGNTPMCAFFVKELNKIPDQLDIRKLF